MEQGSLGVIPGDEVIVHCLHIAPDEVSAKKHPRVNEWWTIIQARPAFARANIGPFVNS